MFKVPADIIFESPEAIGLNTDTLLDFDEDLGFERLSLIKGAEKLNPKWLYIGYVSETIGIPQFKSGEVYAVCVNDLKNQDTKVSNTVFISSCKSAVDVFVEMQKKMVEIQEWYYTMLSALEEGCNMQKLVDISEPHLINYVAVSDSNYKLLAYTQNIDIDDEACIYLKTHGVHAPEVIKKFNYPEFVEIWKKHHYVNKNRLVAKYYTIGRIFRFHDTYFTHAVMTCNNAPPTKAIQARYKVFYDVFGRLVGEAWSKVERIRHVYDTFLINIIEGHLKNKDLIEQRSNFVGLPYNGPFIIGELAPTVECDLSISRLAHEFGSKYTRSKLFIYSDRILFLNHFDVNEFELQLTQLKEKCLDFADTYKINFLISAKLENLSQLSTGYYQILSLDMMLKQVSKESCGLESFCVKENCVKIILRKVFTFDDYYEYCVLGLDDNVLQASSRGRFINALRFLYQYDIKNKINNLQLLRVYLNSERSLVETGNKLHMHRNNVAYRIKKIKSIIDIDLDDPENRYKLLLAYKIFDLKHVLLTDNDR